MHINIRLGNNKRQQMYERFRRAYTKGYLQLMRRTQSLRYIADDKPVVDVANILGLGEQTTRWYVHSFVLRGIASLV